MPGTPFKHALLERIGKEGGWAVILDRIAAGETIGSIAISYGCSRPFLSGLLHHDPELEKLLVSAKREAAASLAEDAGKILDEVPETRDAIAKARLRSEHRMRMAAIYDRETFGEQLQAPIQINIGDVHLQALIDRRRVAPNVPALASAPARALIPPAEFTVEPE